MGREAQLRAEWRGESGPTKALLESRELILRGAVRARIPRESISSVEIRGAGLILRCGGETLMLDFGAADASHGTGGDAAARRWRTALLTPAPSLASKLGVDAEHPAYVVGALDDAELQRALAGATVADPAGAGSIVAVIEDDAGMSAAVELSAALPALPLWCVYPKGSAAAVTGAEVREELRARGYIDTKSSAVSDRLTATRYVHRGRAG